ncbi:hypothetical protein BDZ85DRAFT_12072 [Elsinoe ampelina]|uniref:Uncharacterized protein n=1 Tax=Elsinoe ampelina TaxID=302913 RepID=A0A6A6GRZ1_9PEZI|nr:hypothetical protein BDZ85DRAFT_12072 [Elsinoe ampelina]
MKLLHIRRDRITRQVHKLPSVASAMYGSDDEWSKIYPAVPSVSSGQASNLWAIGYQICSGTRNV